MAEESKQLVKKDVGQQVIDRVSALCEAGFTMPNGYNFINAIKASMLMLQEVVDKNKRPALEVCTKESIQSFLFNMCIKGLDVSKKTCYPIVRGNKLCLHEGYFGAILQVRRLYPNWTPVAHTVREGDEFIYTINPENGKMKLVKHEQKLENLDKDFIGAYMYLPCADGEPELYVMTRKQILTAWSKSSNTTLTTHKQFDEKMALKTIYNSGCQKVINSTPDNNSVHIDDEDPTKPIVEDDVIVDTTEHFDDFEEVVDEQKDVADEQPKEEPQQPTQEQPNDDEF